MESNKVGLSCGLKAAVLVPFLAIPLIAVGALAAIFFVFLQGQSDNVGFLVQMSIAPFVLLGISLVFGGLGMLAILGRADDGRVEDEISALNEGLMLSSNSQESSADTETKEQEQAQKNAETTQAQNGSTILTMEVKDKGTEAKLSLES